MLPNLSVHYLGITPIVSIHGVMVCGLGLGSVPGYGPGGVGRGPHGLAAAVRPMVQVRNGR